MNLRGKLEMTAMSDVGLTRTHNEDSIGNDTDIGLAVLADGMGGYRAGEIASAIAINMVMERLRKAFERVCPGELDASTGYTRGTMMVQEAMNKANTVIFQSAQDQPQCHGMGTTVLTVFFYDDRMSVGHVGDSRLYRLRNDAFEQLTVDHSLVQELVDKGFYSPEEARRSAQRNLVTRALGIGPEVQTEVFEETVLPEDLFLLCSDGLTDLVEDSEIHLTLSKYSANLEQAAQQLIQLANQNGGTDNISVILVRVLTSFTQKMPANWYSRVVDWFG